MQYLTQKEKTLMDSSLTRCDDEGVPCIVQQMWYSYFDYTFRLRLFNDRNITVDAGVLPSLSITRRKISMPEWRDLWLQAESIGRNAYEKMTRKASKDNVVPIGGGL